MESPKKKLANRAIARAESGLMFLKFYLYNKSGSTDVAFSRSLYILLSFNFELILKSILIIDSKKETDKEIIEELKNMKQPHNFSKLYKKIKPETLIANGLQKVEKKENGGFTEYHVLLNNGDRVITQDLVDVRYDFGKDNLRKIYTDEIDRIKKEVEDLLIMVKKIRINIEKL